MSEDESSSASVSLLRDELTCPVCLRLPREAPVYQCDAGHLLCSDCHPKCHNVCPVCRKSLGKIRSILADKLVALMRVPCVYCDQGCSVELRRERLKEHELNCNYRPVCCVDIACGQKVPFGKMLEHMNEQHEREDFVHANSNAYKSYFIVNASDFEKEIMWISDHLILEDKHFFRECCRNSLHRPNGNPEDLSEAPDNGLESAVDNTRRGVGHWYIWVYMLGTAAEAADYCCTIKVWTDGEDALELSFKGQVNALTVDKSRMLSEVVGLVFPDAVAKQFWRDDKIFYSVLVERKPPRTRGREEAQGASASTLKESNKNDNKNVASNSKNNTERTNSFVAAKSDNKGNRNKDARETPC